MPHRMGWNHLTVDVRGAESLRLHALVEKYTPESYCMRIV